MGSVALKAIGKGVLASWSDDSASVTAAEVSTYMTPTSSEEARLAGGSKGSLGTITKHLQGPPVHLLTELVVKEHHCNAANECYGQERARAPHAAGSRDLSWSLQPHTRVA